MAMPKSKSSLMPLGTTQKSWGLCKLAHILWMLAHERFSLQILEIYGLSGSPDAAATTTEAKTPGGRWSCGSESVLMKAASKAPTMATSKRLLLAKAATSKAAAWRTRASSKMAAVPQAEVARCSVSSFLPMSLQDLET
ncbi:unnamed protein product [Effrenium voratum]|uniref:Uncharacterized protein n=1 Tax=Effrenium voratum TaxID=2562239 RepID=A0AA36IVZ5_9DINO|nr:unnamed protein product [Effrenium voratum]